MELREWKTILTPYEFAVEELKVKFKNIRKELKANGEYSPIEFVTGRVKKISSIISKAEKLGVSLDEVEEKIEDIAGIRIMCQFVEDIYTVVSLIKSREDMKIVYEKDYIKNYKASGYRSYHVILEYPFQTAKGLKTVIAEVQIRTLAMNFWATIEHSLKYKYDQGVPKDLASRLSRAGDAAFLLDQEMSEIRDIIVRAQVMFEMKSIAIKDILDGIQELNSLGYSHEAVTFQEKFDKISDFEDIDKMFLFKRELDELLNKYRKNSC
ncbi:putative GTP pyrophosphokinase [Peptoclostridium litorale DSM 5388]|uniref:Putative guanosine 3',5'-bis-pyrophosphate (PpGpp) synthesis/degradation protein n=1 Tax=Peptoclostridium litorale DSM 5388 TaxID=1121324 RepID=A0A069RNB9_PEPLI|nr:GTP pyrophosphokinase family protein [Peptoclostridium litorale]KDR95667.1 putative guanosine 3',5'-bis-pyrophosphate (PpGpp) synthesis/degradation protein [Peptoclostridium litorale DSM 5388]SIO00655.1 putative GTP pyrophosphokinase [Peptoclostridium litorale DSM 5388]